MNRVIAIIGLGLVFIIVVLAVNNNSLRDDLANAQVELNDHESQNENENDNHSDMSSDTSNSNNIDEEELEIQDDEGNNNLNTGSENQPEENEANEEEPGFHMEASQSAYNFLQGYFDYEESPNEDDVLPFISENVEDKLHFDATDIDEIEEGDEGITSEVSDVNVYYGDFDEDSQELLITFTNTLVYDDVGNETMSFLWLGMVRDGSDWIVDDMIFDQYH